MKSFSNKVAIITGGGSGIGKEVAKQLVTAGASVVIGGRDAAKLAQAAQGKAVVTDSDEEAGLPDPEMREAETLENMIEEDA
mgnify:CR=1 FL=1